METIIVYYHEEGRFPDIIIIDMRMPIMNGFELIARVKEHPNIEKVVFKPLDKKDLLALFNISV